MRRIGLLGVLVTLLLAAGALAPLMAHGAISFNAGTYPATVHGSASKGSEVIYTAGGNIECAAAYHAELQEASTTMTLTPSYSNCEAFGFLSATVNLNGCTYLMHVFERLTADEHRASFDISCAVGKAIKVTAGTCEIEIGAQNGLNRVKLTNDTEATPKRDITFKPEVTGLAYTVLKDGFGCPFLGTGSKTGGTFSASPGTTLTGQSPSSPETKIGVEIGEPLAGASFRAMLYPVAIDGSGGQVKLTLEGQTIECAGTYHAELQGNSLTLPLAPIYSECKAFGFLSATFYFNECKYLLQAPAKSSEDEYEATLDVSCEAGKAIKILSGKCEIEIGPQSELSAVELSNDTAATPKKDITFEPEITGLSYKVLEDGFACPFNGTGSKTDGTLTAGSATTLTGQSPGNSETKIGIEIDH